MTSVNRSKPYICISLFALGKGFPDPACRAPTLLYIKKNSNSPSPERKPLMNSAHKSSWRRMRVRISYHGDAKRFSYGGKVSDAPISDVGFRAAVRVPKTADRQVDALVETDYYQAGRTEKDLREIVWRRFDRI